MLVTAPGLSPEKEDRVFMSADIPPVEDAIAAARAAVASNVANVAAAIDAAVTDIDQQLATLHERREALDAALAAVNAQIAAVDGHREALITARTQAPSDSGDGAGVHSGGGAGSGAGGAATPSAAGSAAGEPDQPADDEAEEGDGGYLEFTEEELDPAVARTERIVTVLTRAQYGMRAGEIGDILNQFGDDTTAKVVGGTLASLVRRGLVTKEEPGVYAAS